MSVDITRVKCIISIYVCYLSRLLSVEWSYIDDGMKKYFQTVNVHATKETIQITRWNLLKYIYNCATLTGTFSYFIGIASLAITT